VGVSGKNFSQKCPPLFHDQCYYSYFSQLEKDKRERKRGVGGKRGEKRLEQKPHFWEKV
jgi:hypothetical protein